MKKRIQKFLLKEFPLDITMRDGEVYLRNELIQIDYPIPGYDCTVRFRGKKTEIDLDEPWMGRQLLKCFIKKEIMFLDIYKSIFQCDKKAFIYEKDERSVYLFFVGQVFELYVDIEFLELISNNYDVKLSFSVVYNNKRQKHFTLQMDKTKITKEALGRIVPFFKEKRMDLLFHQDRKDFRSVIPKVFNFNKKKDWYVEDFSGIELEKLFFDYFGNTGLGEMPLIHPEDISRIKEIHIEETKKDIVVSKGS